MTQIRQCAVFGNASFERPIVLNSDLAPIAIINPLIEGLRYISQMKGPWSIEKFSLTLGAESGR